MVRDGDASALIVEDKVVRTLEASSVFPVPGSASFVGYFLDGSFHTDSVMVVVAFIAGNASS